MGLCQSITTLKREIKQEIPEDLEVKKVTPFVPPITGGRVIKCYDGDTITIASYLPYKDSPLYKFSVRLNGIDCPEMKTKNEHEKQVAQIAKKTLADRILNKMITLENVSTEKYGRVLADVIHEGVSMGPWLAEKHMAVSYAGGTKEPPKDWLAYYKENAPEPAPCDNI